ncbi:hypothetical protein A7D00_6541 [Trichophyton violaceum]|uniref:Uncharacterized protein n=1 Tax=Trichophyton violaceum TaxID=34388 RepID=A0A178FA51_TRIVO|nr:hypothetical protein A7D00_6541 [Trichophyton violaceum]
MLFSKLLVASCISPVFGSLLPKDYVSDLIARQAPGEDIVIIEDDDWLKSLGKATATLHRRHNNMKYPYIDKLREVLKKTHQIDGQWPPVGEVNPVHSSLDCTLGCSGWCDPASTYQHQTLRTIANVTVTGSPHVDEVFENPNDDPLDIEVKKGTAVARGNTKGWSIGVGLNGGLGPLSAEFSGQITQTTEETTTETREVSWKGKCPAKSECLVTTVTFSITVEGQCDESIFAFCLLGEPQKRDMCGEHREQFLTCVCPEHKGIIEGQCPKDPNRPQLTSCEVTFPLKKPDGSLRTVQFLAISPLSK